MGKPTWDGWRDLYRPSKHYPEDEVHGNLRHYVVTERPPVNDECDCDLCRERYPATLDVHTSQEES